MFKKGTKAITVRGAPPRVKKRKPVLHHDLDRLLGAWNFVEASAFDRALRERE
jgi:hypothetical protein